ncbi:MAG: hypothetical protein K6C99_11085 [Lachnospiraceae bacterium]|nr:hypothetical protein [Lachnospiraceae bacterium]
MKKSVIACLLLAVTVLSAGCGSQKKANPIESTHDETDIQVTNSSNVNHGYSITDRTEPHPKEILRSDEVLHDEFEARDFLLDNINYPEREPYTFSATASSVNDPGAYLWYDFTVFYNNIPIEGSEFTVITFNDGTIIEGDEGLFRAIPADLSGIKTPDEILEIYAKQNYDDRDYKYQNAHYYYKRRSGECPYVYVYRYDCGKVLENITLTLNAETGELLGYRPDAID